MAFSRFFDTCLDDPCQSPGVHENELKKETLLTGQMTLFKADLRLRKKVNFYF